MNDGWHALNMEVKGVGRTCRSVSRHAHRIQALSVPPREHVVASLRDAKTSPGAPGVVHVDAVTL